MKQVIIVGGGIVGATIAYELSQHPQLKITLIDRNTPSEASTVAALGILMGIISHKTKGRAWQLREASMRRYPQLLKSLSEQTGETVPHVQGLINLCFVGEDMTKWEELARLRHSQGWTLEIWDTAKLKTQCPYLNTDSVTAAIYSPQDFQLNPQALTRLLLRASEQNGVNIQKGVEATDVSVTDNGEKKHCHTLHTNQGDWETDELIIAAGLGTFPLTRQLQQPVTLSPVLGQAMRVGLSQDFVTPNQFQPVITGDDVHVVPLGKGEYWLGATVEFPQQPVARYLSDIREKSIEYCPPLANAHILETWSGKRPRPEGKAAPVIEYLAGYDNVILATGHYRNGVLLAPATAEIVKNMIFLPNHP